ISPLYNLNTQIFNLGPNIRNVKNTEGLQNSISLNDNILISFDNNTSFNARESKHSIGKYAEKFHSLTNTLQLKLNKNGKHQTMTTLIQNQYQSIFSVKTDFLEFNKIILSNNKKQYILDLQPELETFTIDKYLHINNLNNLYFWKVYSNNYSEEEYVFYIYKNDIRFDTIWYTENNTIEYEFYEPGTYSIRCFIRNKNNQSEKTEFRNENKIYIND